VRSGSAILVLALVAVVTAGILPDFSVGQIDLSGKWRFAIDPETIGQKHGWYREDFDDSKWAEIPVPGKWEDAGFTEQVGEMISSWKPYNGCAWYRLRVRIPEEWRGFPLLLYLGRIDDMDITYWNGQEIGKSDSVESERAYRLEPAKVKFGQLNTIAVRVVDIGGDGGIFPGPVYIRPITPWEDCKLIIEPDSSLRIYRPGEVVRLKFTAVNAIDEDIAVNVMYKILDYRDKVLKDGRKRVAIKARGKTTFEIQYKPRKLGHFDVQATMQYKNLAPQHGYSSFAVLKELPPVKEPEKSYFGICAGALFHAAIEDIPTAGKRRLVQSRLTGAVWGRNDFWWSVIEPENDKFDWRKADLAVKTYEEAGLKLLIILCYASAWSGRAPDTAEEIANFADYAYHMVQRYKDRVKYWEIWNEPNIAPFWVPDPRPEKYYALLKEAYKAIKKADPEAVVIGCCTAGTALPFIECVLRLGGGQYMDALSIHPYQAGSAEVGSEFGKIKELVRIMVKYKVNKPIWITEMGWTSIDRESERRQANYVVRLYATAMSGEYNKWVKRVYYFNQTDWGPRWRPKGGHWGLAYSDSTPKPALVAYHTTAYYLRNAKFLRSLNLGERARFHIFLNDGKLVGVGWMEEGKKEVQLPFRKACVIDIMGNTQGILRGNKWVKVLLEEEPKFLILEGEVRENG